VVWLRYRLQNR